MTTHTPAHFRHAPGPSRPSAFWILILTLPAILAAGCAGVEPHQRGVFGSYTMRADRDPLDNVFREHIHFTREAATGGTGVGGGGCGCN